jgi:hypothetical protein
MEDLQIVLHAAMPMKRTLSGTVCSAQTHVYQLHCLLEKFSQELNLPPESAQLIQARLTEKISRLSATRAKSIIGIIASTLSAVQKARSGDDSAQAGVRSALELMGRASSLEGFNVRSHLVLHHWRCLLLRFMHSLPRPFTLLVIKSAPRA